MAESGNGCRERSVLWSRGGPARRGALRVSVRNEDASTAAGKLAGQVHRQGGLAWSAFLVHQSDDASRVSRHTITLNHSNDRNKCYDSNRYNGRSDVRNKGAPAEDGRDSPAKCIARVVLPGPPFWFTRAMMRAG